MATRYVYLGSGSKADLETIGKLLEENDVPEGGLVELVLKFDSRFSGFESMAVTLDNNLRDNIVFGEVLRPWPNNYQVVYVDPDNPRWIIRYRKGIAWIPWVCAALIMLAIAWVAFVSWDIYRAIAGAIGDYPWIIPVAVIGIVGTALMNAAKRPIETTTRWR